MLNTAIQNHLPEDGKLLWVLEEAGNITPALVAPYASRSTVLSNRCDLHQQYQTLCRSILSDFELAENDFAAAIFYVSKERLISNYVIAAAANWLNASGTLVLAGKKNEGIKNYFAKLNAKSTLKKNGDLYIGAAYTPPRNPEALASYSQEHTLAVDEHTFILSKPGVFSWKQVDQGSAFLFDTLKTIHPDLKAKTVLDLGCGNGYLAVAAARLGATRILATDNNYTAIAVCQKNFQLLDIQAEARVDDCAANIRDKFDLVLCNPPFHKGKEIDTELTLRFIAAAKRLLNAKGEAWFVVNAFIPLEIIAEHYFSSVATLVNNRQFKVLRLRNNVAVA